MKRTFLALTIAMLSCSSAMAATGTAPDRLHWSDVSIDPSLVSAGGLAYGNGQFVAVKGRNRDLYSSPDGEQWTAIAATGPLFNIYYANGRFVADSDSGIGKPMMVSDDARSWEQVTNYGKKKWSGNVAYGRGRYVVLSQSPSAGSAAENAVTVLSADLKLVDGALSRDPGYVHGVVYGKGLFVVGSGKVGAAYSADGLPWTQATDLPADSGLGRVAYGGGRFVAVGGVRDGGLVYTSTDGKQWTRASRAARN